MQDPPETTQLPHSSRRLSAEQERALFEEWRAHGRAAVRAELIESSLWLVALVAREQRCMTSDRADLIAEGHIGLLTAFDRFDETRGVRFATYARHWVAASMRAFLLRSENALGSLARGRMHAKLRREARRGHPSTADRPWEVRDVSLDAPLPGDTSTLLDRLAAEAIDPDTAIESARRSAALSEAVQAVRSTFDSRERIIFEARFLAGEDEEGTSRHEVGQVLALSRERVRQLEERVRQKLVDRLRVTLATAEELPSRGEQRRNTQTGRSAA